VYRDFHLGNDLLVKRIKEEDKKHVPLHVLFLKIISFLDIPNFFVLHLHLLMLNYDLPFSFLSRARFV
jgi:hypothetical protein